MSLKYLTRVFISAALLSAVLTPALAMAELPAAPASSSASVSDSVSASASAAPLILISIDGFKPAYLQRGISPNLLALAKNGVRAEAMRPSFPSITFPNHYTLVTGLRPDHHGIVGNTMEDSAIPGVQFKLDNRAAVTDRRWWDQAEPVWVSAEKAGLPTATMYWPGSEADIQGVRPGLWARFDSSVSASDRVARLLQWLDLPAAQRPRFLTLYFDQVDHQGHDYGPDSSEVNQAVAEVDHAIGELLQGLQQRAVNANLVIVSDHGMAAVSRARIIELKSWLPANSYRLINSGSYAGLQAREGHAEQLRAALAKAPAHLQCWPKAEIPARFEFGKNPRVSEYICLADSGWLVLDKFKPNHKKNGGAHGYDNLSPDMAALFIAAGPAFRQDYRFAGLDNVDVYPLLMKLLGLPPLPSDGKAAVTAELLR